MPTASWYNSGFVRNIKRFRPLVAAIKECQRGAGLAIRPVLVSKYLRSHETRKLQIGAHRCMLSGWLNTDMYPQSLLSVSLNATRRFPFPDQSFDYVFSEHQMEHIDYRDAQFMLQECWRILRPGGKIRIAVPSVDRLVDLYRQSRTDLQEQYIRHVTRTCYPEVDAGNPCFALNSSFLNWGHKFLYDRATLSAELERARFHSVRFFTPGESDDPHLRGIETRTSETDIYETMVAQAVRA